MNFFSSSLSKKLLASYVGLTLVSVLFVGLWSETAYRRRVLADTREQLSRTTALLASQFRDGFGGRRADDLQAFVVNTGRTAGTRITLIGPDGTVLADSEESPAKMENHGSRPEILEALARSGGESSRYSSTLHAEMIYFAQAVRADGRLLGVVRVAFPKARISQGLADIKQILFWGVVLTFLVAIGVSAWIARGVSSPVTGMIGVVRAIKAGRLGERVPLRGESDLARLGDEINQMADELSLRTELAAEERKKTELALAALRAGVFTLDSEDRLLFWNDTAFRFLDWVDLPRPGQPLSESIRSASLLEMVDEVRRDRAVSAREITSLGKEKDKIFGVHAMPCGGDGIMVILRDITNFHYLERARQDFVVNASHELKTPLTAIKGYVDTLLDGADGDPGARRRFLEQLSGNVNRLVFLADDLLNLSRIESQQETLELAVVDCRRLVSEAAEHFRSAASRKGLDLSVETPAEDVSVVSHEASLRRILDNLLDNAVKYTRAPGKIAIYLSGSGAGTHEARIEVRDTGIGIPKADIERIFERFYRVDKARSVEAGGTGLGLSIVKHLLVKLRGRIEVESEFGQGSRFTVHLPRSL